ncbi:hypothetical protein [Streptomyces sp. NPDC088727]|uniref:hypothetical protein n=1 Tax=Streptomyces sp. NPDC088727 TaxID=3365875 RepID=UPI0037FBA28A
MARPKPVPEYTVRRDHPDGYPVYRVVRTSGPNKRSLTEYTSQDAANAVAAALNAAAPHED